MYLLSYSNHVLCYPVAEYSNGRFKLATFYFKCIIIIYAVHIVIQGNMR